MARLNTITTQELCIITKSGLCICDDWGYYRRIIRCYASWHGTI